MEPISCRIKLETLEGQLAVCRLQFASLLNERDAAITRGRRLEVIERLKNKKEEINQLEAAIARALAATPEIPAKGPASLDF